MNVKGIVYMNYTRGKDRTIMLEIDENENKELFSAIKNNMDNPIKHGSVESGTDGKTFLKVHSQFPVKIFLDAVFLTDGDTECEDDENASYIDTIGTGSLVVVNFNLREGDYKRKKYQSAYLKAVNVLNLVEQEPYNPFAE